MTAQELISSGKLELYVAGVLSVREMEEVAAVALEHPEVAGEIEKIEQVMVAFLSPEETRQSEMEAALQIDSILHKIHDLSSPAPRNGRANDGRVVAMHWRVNWAVAALLIGLVLTAGLALWLGMRNSRMSDDLATMKTTQSDMATANNQFQDKLTHMQKQVDLMRNILTRRVQLATVAGNKITSQDNYMLVYWNPQTKKLLLVDAHLPALSPDQEYQLWALYGNQALDAGVFDVSNVQLNSSFQKDIANAQAFAVTVEPRGGSKTPTLSNLCMMGKL